VRVKLFTMESDVATKSLLDMAVQGTAVATIYVGLLASALLTGAMRKRYFLVYGLLGYMVCCVMFILVSPILPIYSKLSQEKVSTMSVLSERKQGLLNEILETGQVSNMR